MNSATDTSAVTPMPQYQSHKKVWALQIASVTELGTDTTADGSPIVEAVFKEKRFAARKFNLRSKPTPRAGWYYVQYEDGYESFSPAEQFEKGNTLIVAGDNPHGVWHSIGWAIKQIHDGALVRRRGWNGAGLFIFLVAGSHFEVNRAPLLGIFPQGTGIDYRAHVDMKTVDGSIVPWVCSQSDLLALDWEIFS